MLAILLLYYETWHAIIFEPFKKLLLSITFSGPAYDTFNKENWSQYLLQNSISQGTAYHLCWMGARWKAFGSCIKPSCVALGYSKRRISPNNKDDRVFTN